MSQDKCPHCGSPKSKIFDCFDCGASVDGEYQTALCEERAAHAETRKDRDAWQIRCEAYKQAAQLSELAAKKAEAALTGEREKWERLRTWAYDYFSDSERNPVVVDEMNRLDAEAKGGR